MIEKYFVEFCAPTLASIKTANLFSISNDYQYELNKYSDFFENKGIKISVLKKDTKTLVYVYRVKKLENDLFNPTIKQFLKQFGYDYDTTLEAIEHLKQRIKTSSDFPHEIGLFLGYPFEDVKSFIKYSGKNYKICGCWKVYSDEKSSLKAFEKFNKCKENYLKQWLKGSDLFRLTVTA